MTDQQIAYHHARQNALNVAFREAMVLNYSNRVTHWLHREAWKHRYAVHKLRYGKQPKNQDDWHNGAYPEDLGYDTDNRIDEMHLLDHCSGLDE